MSNGNGNGRDIFGIDRADFDDEERPFIKPDKRSADEPPDVAADPAKNIVEFTRQKQGLTDEQKRGLNRLASAIDQLNTRVGNISTGPSFEPPVYPPGDYSDMLHYWPMDDGATDAAGSADLTKHNNPGRTTGLRGTGAYSMTGNGYLQGSVPASSFTGNTFTASSWFTTPDVSDIQGNSKPVFAMVENGSPKMGIIAEIDDEGSPDFSFQITTDDSTNIKVPASATTNTHENVVEANNFSLNVGDLAHILVSWDGAAMTIFVNGILAARREVSKNFTIDTDLDVIIGGFPASDIYTNLETVDEFMIMDEPKNWTEAGLMYVHRYTFGSELYDPHYNPDNFNNLIAYFPLNDSEPGNMVNKGSLDKNLDLVLQSPKAGVDVADSNAGTVFSGQKNNALLESSNIHQHIDPQNVSLASWFNVPPAGSGSCLLGGTTLSLGSPPAFGLFTQGGTNNEIGALIQLEGDTALQLTGPSVDDGQWHSAMVHFDGSYAELYLDGTAVDEQSLGSTLSIKQLGSGRFVLSSGTGSPQVAISDVMLANDFSFDYTKYRQNGPNFYSADQIFPVLADISLATESAGTDTVDLTSSIDTLDGTDVESTDTIEYVGEVLDAGSVVSSDRSVIELSAVPTQKTITATNLTSGYTYDWRGAIEVNGKRVAETNQGQFTTSTAQLYSESSLESNGGDVGPYLTFDADQIGGMSDSSSYNQTVSPTGPDIDHQLDTSLLNGTYGIEFLGTDYFEVDDMSGTIAGRTEFVVGFWMQRGSHPSSDQPLFRLFDTETTDIIAEAVVASSTENSIQARVFDSEGAGVGKQTDVGAYNLDEWTHVGISYTPEGLDITVQPLGGNQAVYSTTGNGNPVRTASGVKKLNVGADDGTNVNANTLMDEFVVVGGESGASYIQGELYNPSTQ